MSRKHQINADPEAQDLRSRVAAAIEPVRSAAWTVESRFMWRGADVVRALARKAVEAAKWPLERLAPQLEWLAWSLERLAAALRRLDLSLERLVRPLGRRVIWPLERLAWPLERRVVWSLQELADERGISVSGRAAGAGALVGLTLGAALFAGLSATGDDGSPEQIAERPRISLLAERGTAPAQKPAGQILQGVSPSFDLGGEVRIAPKSGEAVARVSDGSTAAKAPAEEPSATTSKQRPVPAGPAAMKVARRFADAFVYYEIGERPARTRRVFKETTTTDLAAALKERPPRQPATVEVPQARVLNLVPGPRRGRAFTVSASLLRVGVISELRLELVKRDGSWLITDVRG